MQDITQDITNVKRFSDFCVKPVGLDGNKKKIGDIIGKEIIIIAFQILKGKFSTKECVKVQFMESGEKWVFFTGSAVIKDLLVTYEAQLPFSTKIVKIDRYFTLT